MEHPHYWLWFLLSLSSVQSFFILDFRSMNRLIARIITETRNIFTIMATVATVFITRRIELMSFELFEFGYGSSGTGTFKNEANSLYESRPVWKIKSCFLGMIFFIFEFQSSYHCKTTSVLLGSHMKIKSLPSKTYSTTLLNMAIWGLKRLKGKNGNWRIVVIYQFSTEKLQIVRDMESYHFWLGRVVRMNLASGYSLRSSSGNAIKGQSVPEFQGSKMVDNISNARLSPSTVGGFIWWCDGWWVYLMVC